VNAELLISRLLRIGVAASMTLVVAGMVIGVISPLGHDVAMLGLLLLIATPVLRVAMSIYVFARERDTTYVVITTLVLLLLILSFVLGAAGA
jgi:uncharacterized membrane protein